MKYLLCFISYLFLFFSSQNLIAKTITNHTKNFKKQKLMEPKVNQQLTKQREREFDHYLSRFNPDIQQNIRNNLVGLGQAERNAYIDKLLNGAKKF